MAILFPIIYKGGMISKLGFSLNLKESLIHVCVGKDWGDGETLLFLMGGGEHTALTKRSALYKMLTRQRPPSKHLHGWQKGI